MTAFNRRMFLGAVGATWLAAATRGWARQDVANSPPFDDPGFAKKFGGTVFRAGSPEYAQLSRIYQARTQIRPALFAHCTSRDDVRRALLAARETQSPLSVRCGGHSYAGYSLNEGGVVLDMSGLQKIEIAADGASVTVGGGVLAGMIDRATTPLGRAMTLGQCPTVGIGGLALGGGVGLLMGRQGLVCDNLLSAEIVLSDGRNVIASEDGDGELYWAIRGGGGNFGVATELTFRLHEIRDVTGGFITMSSPDPREMLQLYADQCMVAPDHLVMLGMLVPDEEGRPLLMIQICHSGPPEMAERDIAAILLSPHVIENDVKRRPYAELQMQGPPELPIIPTINRAGFRSTFDEAAIDTLARALEGAPGPYMHGLVPIHGAVTNVEQSATAFPFRHRGIAYGLTSILTGPEQLTSAREWISTLNVALHEPGSGAYVNVMDDEGPDAVRAAYGGNYARLAELKARYDPLNTFQRNANIAP